MELSRFPLSSAVRPERPEPVAPAEPKQRPTVEEARADLDSAEAAWRHSAQQARLASDPNTAAAALMMASQAATRSAQAQTIYAEARAKLAAAKAV